MGEMIWAWGVRQSSFRSRQKRCEKANDSLLVELGTVGLDRGSEKSKTAGWWYGISGSAQEDMPRARKVQVQATGEKEQRGRDQEGGAFHIGRSLMAAMGLIGKISFSLLRSSLVVIWVPLVVLEYAVDSGKREGDDGARAGFVSVKEGISRIGDGVGGVGVKDGGEGVTSKAVSSSFLKRPAV